MAEGAGLPKGRDGAHHQLGVELVDFLPAKTEAPDNAGGKVLDEHVALFNQVGEYGLALFVFNIDTEAFLAAVLLHKISAAFFFTAIGKGAAGVAERRHFNFNNIGAEFGHQSCGGGAGEVLGEVDDFVAIEYGHGRHGLAPWAHFTKQSLIQ